MEKKYSDHISQNPAFRFLNTDPENPSKDASVPVDGPAALPRSRKENNTPTKISEISKTEIKSRRTQILFYPSLYKLIAEEAAKRKMSVNDFINSIFLALLNNEN